jgi:hypothetical protein
MIHNVKDMTRNARTSSEKRRIQNMVLVRKRPTTWPPPYK